MKKLIVVGAGGFGKEVAWMAKRCGRKVAGFLDSTPEKQNTVINGVPVLGAVEQGQEYMDCDFVIAIGNPRARQKIVRSFFNDEKFTFATLIDPSVIVGENVSIEAGSIICAGSILTVDIKVGMHSIININSTIGHDVEMGDYITVAPNASISGNILISNLVEIGTNATLREKLIVQEGAMIGMGAVVTKNVEQNCVMVGNPAKLLKRLDNGL